MPKRFPDPVAKEHPEAGDSAGYHFDADAKRREFAEQLRADPPDAERLEMLASQLEIPPVMIEFGRLLITEERRLSAEVEDPAALRHEQAVLTETMLQTRILAPTTVEEAAQKARRLIQLEEELRRLEGRIETARCHCNSLDGIRQYSPVLFGTAPTPGRRLGWGFWTLPLANFAPDRDLPFVLGRHQDDWLDARPVHKAERPRLRLETVPSEPPRRTRVV